MGVSGDRQMWVRGPTAQQAPAPPATTPPPAARATTPAPAAPAARAATAAPARTAAPATAYAPAGVRPAAARPQAQAQAAARSTDWPVAPEPPEQVAHQGYRVSWVNAHGGAGASTLARELGGADLGRRWPDPARGEPGRVLLVARTHHAGMRAAGRALDALRKENHPQGISLVALVLVADAPGRLPMKLGRRIRVLRSAARVHRLPWVPAWRSGKSVPNPPRAIRSLADLAEGTKR
ncbi:DUF6668 family protein [Streptomyces sp. NPDC087294]|uniref:DUF6668 family protein n=1 Tax=Streptomyces sp. NPDC087294 TaxID=3365777 RepID=UPI00381E24EC